MGRMSQDLGMRSRVQPKYKTKYRVSNWADYDRALVQRGDITLWISEDAIATWKPVPSGRRGAQKKVFDHVIQTALTLRLGSIRFTMIGSVMGPELAFVRHSSTTEAHRFRRPAERGRSMQRDALETDRGRRRHWTGARAKSRT
jgi:hypothetical protein